MYNYARDNVLPVKVILFYRIKYGISVINFISFQIFIGDPYITQIVRDMKVTTTSFIGNTGGLIGMFQ